jgi:hypothetical protein
MSDDVGDAFTRALNDLGSVTLSNAGKITSESEWKVRKKIDEGRYESYLDGRIRKVTLRSIKADQERLLKAQPLAEILPPADAWKKAVEVRAHGHRLAADGSKPRSPQAPRQQGKPVDAAIATTK